jgi:hypothetical protein
MPATTLDASSQIYSIPGCGVVGGNEGWTPPRQFGSGPVCFCGTPPDFSIDRGMLRDVILWLAGVPIFVIILLHVFGLMN